MDITFFNIKVFFFLIQTNCLDSIMDKSYTKPNFNKNGFKNRYGLTSKKKKKNGTVKESKKELITEFMV